MKLCALLIVAAVCAVLLPSDVDAGVASPGLRALASRSLLEIAKRQFAKRDDDDSDTSLPNFFESDFVTDVLDRYDLTMQELSDYIDADDEIEPENRDAIKGLTILMMAGVVPVDLDSSEEVSSEEA